MNFEVGPCGGMILLSVHSAFPGQIATMILNSTQAAELAQQLTDTIVLAAMQEELSSMGKFVEFMP